MLRRQVLAAALYVLCGAATAASSRSAEVMEAFFRKFGMEGRTYVLRESRLESVRQARHRRRDFGSVSIRLISDAEYIDIFADGKSCSAGWTEFHKRYPNSKVLLQFSAVRFTKGGAEASVLVQVSSACLGGTIDRYRFLRRGSSWHFADSENIGRA